MLQVLVHVLAEEERRHEVRPVPLQGGDRRVVHQVPVLDRVHTRVRGPAHALGAVRVRGHLPAEPVGVRHDRLHLLERVLRRVRVVSLREHPAGRADLDHVRAVLDDLADLVLHSLDAVRHAVSLEAKRRRQQVLVAVPARDAERRPRRDDAGADDVAVVDGVAQGDVRVVAGAQVAHGREPGLERPPGVPRAVQRLARRRDPQPRVPERAQVEGQVRVHVDQAGKQRGLRQVDRRVARGGLDVAGGGDPGDPVAFDDDGLAGAQLARAHVEHAPGADHRPLRRRRGGDAVTVPASIARTAAATSPRRPLRRTDPAGGEGGPNTHVGTSLCLNGLLGTGEYSRPEYAERPGTRGLSPLRQRDAKTSVTSPAEGPSRSSSPWTV